MKITKTQLRQIIKEELEEAIGVDTALAPFRWLRSMAGGIMAWGRLIKLAYQASERERELTFTIMDKMTELMLDAGVPKNVSILEAVPFWGQAIDALRNLSEEDRRAAIDLGMRIFAVDEDALFSAIAMDSKGAAI